MNREPHVWRHPITGDPISLSEWASWTIQGLIRQWYWVIANVVLSVTWWLRPEWFGDDPSLIKWMVLYSLLAIIVESIVGIGMYNQNIADAQILREMRTMQKQILLLVEAQRDKMAEIDEDIRDISEDIAEFEDILEPDPKTEEQDGSHTQAD